MTAFEHDYAEPITEAWLRSVGFATGRMPCDLVRGPIVHGVSVDGDDYWLVRTWGIPNDARPRTRGDVRDLCRCLGIPLTEASALADATTPPPTAHQEIA